MKKIFNFLESSHPLVYLIIFSVAFLFFLWLLLPPFFADPDSFYHAKIATLMAEGELVKNFPWFEFTNLSEVYIDHHLLYHIFLIPFVLIFPALVGVKLAGITLAAGFFILFFWLLKKLQVAGAFWWSVFMLTVNPFIFRIGLIKTPAAVLILTLLFILALFKRNWLAVFVLSFAYVWLHGSWPLALILAGIFWLISGFNNRTMLGHQSFKDWPVDWLKKIKVIFHHANFIKNLFSKNNLKLPLATFLGTLSGLILNPYFPTNLNFYWLQTFKIGLVNYQDVIGVGGEWYGFGLANLIGSAPIVASIFIVGLATFTIYFKKQTRESWFFLILSIIFFGLTLKARRNIEFLIPYAILFTASSIEMARRFGGLEKFKEFIKNTNKKLIFAILIFLAVSVPTLVIRDIDWAKQGLKGSYDYNRYKIAAQWLANESQEGDIVFHSDWDDSLLLFFHNHTNHYIVGLDPTFFYEKNPDKYWQWVNITLGRESENLYDIIKNQFGARFVLIEKDHERMQRNIALEHNFNLVYEDNEVWIYE